MKVLLIIPPCRREPTSYPPYGAICIGTWLKANNHDVQILNLDQNRNLGIADLLDVIDGYKPDVIGFSAIVSASYKYVKEYAKAIKESSPNIPLILGGQLSNAYSVVLQNIPIDVVVIGEGEITILDLLDTIQNDQSLDDVRGIAFLREGSVIKTLPANQVKNLDALPFPDLELIDMDFYLLNPEDRFFGFIKAGGLQLEEQDIKGKVWKSFTIMTGRGCSDWCTFCSRNIRGLRKHSTEYLINLIEHLYYRHNIKYFTFGDESFISNRKWTQEFLRMLKERKLDIKFYVLGARVDTVDKELLVELKEGGCFMIEFGFEHGSQRMLDMMEKRSTVAENYQAYEWAREVGLHTVPAIVLNMPGETPETVGKIITFLKNLKLKRVEYFVNYAQAFPGTPLYDYALLTGLIKDEDEYLSNVLDLDASEVEESIKRGVFLNFSGCSLQEVSKWKEQIRAEVVGDVRSRYGLRDYFSNFLFNLFLRHMRLIKSWGVRIYFKKYIPIIFTKITVIMRRLKDGLSRRKEVSTKGSNERCLNQYKLTNPELITKIKKFQYDSRIVVQHELNQFIEQYTDEYDGYIVARYPSLRQVNLALQDGSLVNEIMTDTKLRMKEVRMVEVKCVE